jgi:hypothetical protein
MRRLRFLLLGVLATSGAAMSLAAPAGALEGGQLVDASGEGGGGGLAFVLMVVMVAAIAGALFFMDHVRRNRLPDEDE